MDGLTTLVELMQALKDAGPYGVLSMLALGLLYALMRQNALCEAARRTKQDAILELVAAIERQNEFLRNLEYEQTRKIESENP